VDKTGWGADRLTEDGKSVPTDGFAAEFHGVSGEAEGVGDWRNVTRSTGSKGRCRRTWSVRHDRENGTP
jgi:hypothetical protein